MVRFEPGTFHLAIERLNHSAIPETQKDKEGENLRRTVESLEKEADSLLEEAEEKEKSPSLVKSQSSES